MAWNCHSRSTAAVLCGKREMEKAEANSGGLGMCSCIILVKSLLSAFPLGWLLVAQRHQPYTKQEAQRFGRNSGHLDMAGLINSQESFL